MSDEPTFRTPVQELENLTQEIREIKELLRDLAGRVGRIEQHAKRAFGVTAPAGQRRPPSRGAPRPATPVESSLTRDEALKQFDELTHLWVERGGGAVERRLADLDLPDLRFIAQELGIAVASKPGRKTLATEIINRVNQSVMLSQNKNLTPPRSAGTAADEPAPVTPSDKKP
ncbi:MAG TPA: hypothetical protein VGQ83_07940 [Polyangia bacterium]|jgi:hypothetical protein